MERGKRQPPIAKPRENFRRQCARPAAFLRLHTVVAQQPGGKIKSAPSFNFYMGKNTPERKDYIMAKLVVPVEE